MEQIKILDQWEKFSENYNFELKEKVWADKSNQFQAFWNQRIIPDNGELTNDEIDEIVCILDRNAKGNTKEQEAVARAMISQGAWRRMFKEIKSDPILKGIINDILNGTDDKEIGDNLNKLYGVNEAKKNFLTGKNGNAINDIMFAYNPRRYISIVSLNHRFKIIEFFGFQNSLDDEDLPGKKIVESNKIILEGFRLQGVNFPFPRALSEFIYTSLNDYWNPKKKGEEEVSEKDGDETDLDITEEKIEQLKEDDYQKLIHKNFKKIFPEFSYVDEDYQNSHLGHFVTTEGKEMDFLCKDKNGNFIVIELKIKGADKAMGQILCYMGWVKENLCEKNEEVKGIIISEQTDHQLDYAVKMVPGVVFKRMWLEVKIKDWKE